MLPARRAWFAIEKSSSRRREIAENRVEPVLNEASQDAHAGVVLRTRAARIAAPAAGNPAQLPAATTRTGIDFAAGVPLVRSW